MKYSFYVLFAIAILFCSVNDARAGFILKKHTAIEVVAGASASSNKVVALSHKDGRHTHLFSSLKSLTYPLFGYRRRPSEWIGIAALLSGVLGLFVPGLNFLALLFGVLGLGRNCKTRGLAVAGFILGVLETLLFIFFGTMFLSLILL